MPHLNNFKAWIEVDGTAVPEYGLELDPDGRTLRCWIASEEGKSFIIVWQDKQDVFDALGKIYLDGTLITGSVRHHRAPKDTVRTSRMRLNEATEAEFRFARMALTDDESAVLDESTVKALGNIKVEISTGNMIRNHRPLNYKRFQQPKQGPVHETMKKASSHRIELGDPINRHDHTAPMGCKFDADGTPPICFLFQYTSREMLQARGIIAPDKPAAQQAVSRPLGVKREPQIQGSGEHRSEAKFDGDEEADGVETIEAELVVLQQRLAALKKKKRPSDGTVVSQKAKKIKREDAKPNGFFQPGEVIDLTGVEAAL